MHIRNLHLQNFRSHVDTSLDLAKLTIIRAANAAGKSSIEQAIEIALARHAEGTDAGGKGASNLIRLGENRADIKLGLVAGERKRVVQCALKGTDRSVVVTNPEDESWNGGQEWMQWLDANRATLSCLINNRYFINLDEDRQKDILSAIVLPKSYDWPEVIRKQAKDLTLAIDWSKTPFEIIQQGYDLAYKERTSINRDVKNFKMPEGSTDGYEEVDAIRKMLSERRLELEVLVKANAIADQTASEHRRTLEFAQRRISEAQARLEREEQEVTAQDAKTLTKAKLKEKEAIAKGAKRAAELDTEIVRMQEQLRAGKEALERAKEFGYAACCPTCKSPVSVDMMERIAGPITTENNALSTKIDEAFTSRKVLGDAAEAVASITQHTQALEAMEKSKARIRDEQTIIRDAQEKIDELNGAKMAAPPSQEAIEELRGRIQRGVGVLQKVEAAKTLKDNIDAATGKKAKLLEMQKTVESLVKYFDTEVKTELLASSVGAFTDVMNGVLAKWGYTCSFSVDPYEFAVLYQAETGRVKVPLRFLSKSQRYRFATAFQVALAVTSGFRFIVCDEADIYDKDGRNGLFRALIVDDLDQAIVLSTDENLAVPADNQLPCPAVFYRLDQSSPQGAVPTTTVRRLT